jgi:hypothetical protein
MKKTILVSILSMIIPVSFAYARNEVSSAIMTVPYAGPSVSILVEMSSGTQCTVHFIEPQTIVKIKPGIRTTVSRPKHAGYVMAAISALENGESADLVTAYEIEKSRRSNDEGPSGLEQDMANLLELLREKCN